MDDISIIGRNTSGVVDEHDQESDIKVASIAKVREERWLKESNVFDEEFYDEETAEAEDAEAGMLMQKTWKRKRKNKERYCADV